MKSPRTILFACVCTAAAFATAAAGDWRSIPLDSCRKVQGVSENMMGLSLEGKTLYAIGGGTLYALDVSDPADPRLLGSLDGMDNNRQLVVSDGFAYIVSRETGMRIVDVSDPKNMKLRSLYDSVEFATGIDVAGRTAFLSERIYGVEAVDVSDPDRPRHIAMRKTSESQSNRYRDGHLYSGEWVLGNVTVFDAHDMRAFRAVGEVDLGGYGDGLEIAGRYLYCSTGHDARHHRASALTGGSPCDKPRRDLAEPMRKIDESLVGAGRGLDIFDLANPAKPKHVSRIDFPVFKPRNEDFWTVRVADGFAFCCDSHNGLFIVDVNRPDRPKAVARFCVPQPGSPWPSGAISSAAVGEGCCYVASSPGGLWVVPFLGVHPPKREKSVPPENSAKSEPYPTDASLFEVYRPSAAGQARTACVRGDVVYAAFADAGLHVVGIRPDGTFEKLGELPGGRRVTDCCFAGDRLVTAEGVDGWAVYELDGGPAAFREVARRPSGKKIAFWCWNADGESAVLSTRTGPYEVVRLDDFQSGNPLCALNGAACQWNKYMPDCLVGKRQPSLYPYCGLNWIDFSGGVPVAITCNMSEAQSAGNQDNGVCVFADRYLYTVGRRYQFVSPDGVRTELRDLPPDGQGRCYSGIPRSDGRLVAVTSRHSHTLAVYDFSKPYNPKFLRAYELSGNPDLATFWRGRVIVPAGHQGLIMEKTTEQKGLVGLKESAFLGTKEQQGQV